ncbi:MAG: hypothetical protein ACT4PT_02025 [Methanobacteriota archaeon]
MRPPWLEVNIGASRIHLLGTVNGLVSEGRRFLATYEEVRPDALAVGLSPDDVEGLRELVQLRELPEYEPTEMDEAYGAGLSRFGPVHFPAAEYLECARISAEHGIPLLPLDLGEAEYVDVFTKEVSMFQLWRYGRKLRKLATRPPSGASAEEFALRFDAEVRKLGGLDRLERAREARMADRLKAAARDHARILAVVEIARIRGVGDHLSR